jgi:hypothetical protein
LYAFVAVDALIALVVAAVRLVILFALDGHDTLFSVVIRYTIEWVFIWGCNWTPCQNL